MAKRKRRAAKKYPAAKPTAKKSWTGSSLPKLHHPLASRYDKIPVAKARLVVDVHPLVFAAMIEFFLKAGNNETAGYFDISLEDNLIDWLYQDESAKGTGGGVNYGTAWALAAYQADGNKGYPNGQWHTHPGLTAFWSPTDKTAQLQTVDELVASGVTDGAFFFIVFDQLDWLITRITWVNGKPIERLNGTVSLNDVRLDKARTSSYTSYPHDGWYQPPAHKAPTNNTKSTRPSPAPYWSSDKALKGAVPGWIHDRIASGLMTEENAKYMFMGNWSTRNEDYDKLFEIFNVEKYKWLVLSNRIDIYFPDMYYKIVDQDEPWDSIEKQIKEIDKAVAKEIAKYEGADNAAVIS